MANKLNDFIEDVPYSASEDYTEGNKVTNNIVNLLRNRGMSESEALRFLDNEDLMDSLYTDYLDTYGFNPNEYGKDNPETSFYDFIENIPERYLSADTDPRMIAAGRAKRHQEYLDEAQPWRKRMITEEGLKPVPGPVEMAIGGWAAKSAGLVGNTLEAAHNIFTPSTWGFGKYTLGSMFPTAGAYADLTTFMGLNALAAYNLGNENGVPKSLQLTSKAINEGGVDNWWNAGKSWAGDALNAAMVLNTFRAPKIVDAALSRNISTGLLEDPYLKTHDIYEAFRLTEMRENGLSTPLRELYYDGRAIQGISLGNGLYLYPKVSDLEKLSYNYTKVIPSKIIPKTTTRLVGKTLDGQFITDLHKLEPTLISTVYDESGAAVNVPYNYVSKLEAGKPYYDINGNRLEALEPTPGGWQGFTNVHNGYPQFNVHYKAEAYSPEEAKTLDWWNALQDYDITSTGFFENNPRIAIQKLLETINGMQHGLAFSEGNISPDAYNLELGAFMRNNNAGTPMILEDMTLNKLAKGYREVDQDGSIEVSKRYVENLNKKIAKFREIFGYDSTSFPDAYVTPEGDIVTKRIGFRKYYNGGRLINKGDYAKIN